MAPFGEDVSNPLTEAFSRFLEMWSSWNEAFECPTLLASADNGHTANKHAAKKLETNVRRTFLIVEWVVMTTSHCSTINKE
jgi:hypothetical protein